jgi:hypothetical protein
VSLVKISDYFEMGDKKIQWKLHNGVVVPRKNCSE